MSFFITADCEKCGECIQSCPVGVISPDYVIDRDECIYCGACLNVCPYDAIEEIGPGDHIRKTAYDPENENVQKCLEAKTTEEAVSCFPPEVARPYEYISEVSGPASVELKRALLSRKKYLETQRSYDAEAHAEANTGTIAVLILAAISVLIYCMETFMGQYEGKTWYTLLAIVLFFAMIIIISYLFFVHTELDLFGIGAAVVITIVYIKYMHKIPVFIGMMVLCLAAILYLRLSLAARDRRGMGSMEEYDRRISEAADAMFKAFRDNIIDFGWEWSDISPTHTDIWKEAAKAVYGQLEEARSRISDWQLVRQGALINVIPVWKEGTTSSMQDSPDERWWRDIRRNARKVCDSALRAYKQYNKDVTNLVNPLAWKGYMDAIEWIAVGYYNGEGTAKDMVRAMLWAETGCRIAREAEFLDALGLYSIAYDGLIDPDDPYPVYLLALCYYYGNDMVDPDEAVCRRLMREAADMGSSNAQKWLKEN